MICVKLLLDIEPFSFKHYVTSVTRRCRWVGGTVTNIWLSNFCKERTNKRTEIGKKITKVNILYKGKESKKLDAVILPFSYS